MVLFKNPISCNPYGDNSKQASRPHFFQRPAICLILHCLNLLPPDSRKRIPLGFCPLHGKLTCMLSVPFCWRVDSAWWDIWPAMINQRDTAAILWSGTRKGERGGGVTNLPILRTYWITQWHLLGLRVTCISVLALQIPPPFIRINRHPFTRHDLPRMDPRWINFMNKYHE